MILCRILVLPLPYLGYGVVLLRVSETSCSPATIIIHSSCGTVSIERPRLFDGPTATRHVKSTLQHVYSRKRRCTETRRESLFCRCLRVTSQSVRGQRSKSCMSNSDFSGAFSVTPSTGPLFTFSPSYRLREHYRCTQSCLCHLPCCRVLYGTTDNWTIVPLRPYKGYVEMHM